MKFIYPNFVFSYLRIYCMTLKQICDNCSINVHICGASAHVLLLSYSIVTYIALFLVNRTIATVQCSYSEYNYSIDIDSNFYV